jgi:hypothetical protein
MADLDRGARAEARRKRATLKKTHLQPVEEDPSSLRGPEAVSLVHHLTLESWSLAGRQQPTYTRERIPIRFVAGRLT